MDDIVTIAKLNESYGFVITEDDDVIKKFYEHLSFFVPKYRFMPEYKNGHFDGRIKLFNKKDNSFPLGLVPHLYDFCCSQKIQCNIKKEVLDSFKENVFREDVQFFLEQLKFYSRKNRIYPRDDQYEATIRSIERKRCLNICPTSFGKSLSITMECLWYVNRGMKCMIVVPTKDLVDQFYNDIADYATNEEGTLESWYPKVQRIYSGLSKEVEEDTNICISTWQSIWKIYETEPNFMNLFDVVILDECFHEDSKVLTPSGYVKIKDIKPGDKVINYSEEYKDFKVDEVVEVHKNLTSSFSEKMYELEFDNKKIIKVTGNHKFLTTSGWKRADELTEKDEIISCSKANQYYSSKRCMKKYNKILEDNHQKTRIIFFSKNRIILNSGDILTGKKRNSFIKRISKDSWKEVDNWINDSEYEKYIIKQNLSKGGKRAWELHRDEMIKRFKEKTPWNKGLKGLKYNRIITPEQHERIRNSKLGKKNPMYGKKHSIENKIRWSNNMKQLILEGKFSPNTSNRYSHFKVCFNGISYRSSWELLFHYVNKEFEYEVLRIPYKFNDKEKIYIVDFIDFKNKIVVEVKPTNLFKREITKAKIKALSKWCKEHKYKLILCTEKHISDLVKTVDISIFDNDIQRKLRKMI